MESRRRNLKISKLDNKIIISINNAQYNGAWDAHDIIHWKDRNNWIVVHKIRNISAGITWPYSDTWFWPFTKIDCSNSSSTSSNLRTRASSKAVVPQLVGNRGSTPAPLMNCTSESFLSKLVENVTFCSDFLVLGLIRYFIVSNWRLATATCNAFRPSESTS